MSRLGKSGDPTKFTGNSNPADSDNTGVDAAAAHAAAHVIDGEMKPINLPEQSTALKESTTDPAPGGSMKTVKGSLFGG